ncbi:MAG: hypothetical protein ACOX8V_03740 [Thermoleophilia bacterium]|jgi:hypothetical protein
MSLKDKFKQPKNWKIIAGVGTAAVLGLGGIALANSSDVSSVPSPIQLQNQTQATQPADATTLSTTRYAWPTTNSMSSPSSALASTQTGVGTGSAGYATADISLDSPYSPPTTKAASRPTPASPKNKSADSPDTPRTTKTTPAKSYTAPKNVSVDSPDTPRSTKAPATTVAKAKDYSPDYSADSFDSPDSSND